VSVCSTTELIVELIANIGFETCTLSAWTYCNQHNASSIGEVMKTSGNIQCMDYAY
jgi:hypothetical protein